MGEFSSDDSSLLGKAMISWKFIVLKIATKSMFAAIVICRMRIAAENLTRDEGEAE
ncbi:MAG: hypothetical protein Tsb009_29070 [Planctomycetaceae bacterium]